MYCWKKVFLPLKLWTIVGPLVTCGHRVGQPFTIKKKITLLIITYHDMISCLKFQLTFYVNCRYAISKLLSYLLSQTLHSLIYSLESSIIYICTDLGIATANVQYVVCGFHVFVDDRTKFHIFTIPEENWMIVITLLTKQLKQIPNLVQVK